MLNRSGMIYFMALAMMVILMGLGLAYLYIARTEAIINRNEIDVLRTFYLADAAVEHSMAELLYGAGGSDHDGNVQVQVTTSDYYEATYDPVSKMIKAFGESVSVYRHIQAKVNDSGFASAVLANRIDFIDTLNPVPESGLINGNYTTGNADPFRLSNLKLIGQNNSCSPSCDIRNTIPIPDFQYFFDHATVKYGSVPSQFPPPLPPAATRITWSSDKIGNPSDIHFINANLVISHVTDTDIRIDGTVVVTGDVTFGWPPQPLAPCRLTITPAAGKPALIVQGNILQYGGTGGSSPLENTDLVFNGMVYVYGHMAFNDYALSSMDFKTLTINGALVARGSDSVETNIRGGSNVNISYDPDINPDSGSFTGGNVGNPVIVSWQGHQ